MTPEQRHTPGPWEARTFLIKGGVGMRDTICHVGTSTSLGPSRVEESVANARLVAAAPDLLDVLILALPYVETATDDECYKAGAIPEMIKKIRAVIAKASGP